jgi:hypothetical protein
VDASSDFVASEFLEMLGIEHSPFGPTTDSDSESPREKLWKQFEKEALESGDCILGLDFEDGADEASCDDFAEEFDLSAIIHEAELELQSAAPPIDATFTAKSLEDQEAEALMRQFGLNEKSFQSSPRGTRSGFGSPIDIPPELPLELPPLADGLGPFIQTEDGGFLRSMNPALFKNAKNNCSLVMQASSPIVLPAEMGSGIMEILHGLASVGIEKLSMQANKLMPLEDVNGKMMQQLAWGACPALESAGRLEIFLVMLAHDFFLLNHLPWLKHIALTNADTTYWRTIAWKLWQEGSVMLPWERRRKEEVLICHHHWVG